MSVATDYRAILGELADATRYRWWTCPSCRLLDQGETEMVTDRYGFDQHVVDCRCGLRYFGHRWNRDQYANFYQSGAYRRLVSAYHGREMGGCDPDYGTSIYLLISSETTTPISKMRKLDIGGAPSGVILGSEVIDPAIDGQTAETFDPAGRTWDLITVCQTVDHLLEPGAVFKKLATCLAPGGVLFFDVVDFDATREYKIDHPCNFNARSATMLAHVAGLRIDKMERSGNHLRYLCRHW